MARMKDLEIVQNEMKEKAEKAAKKLGWELLKIRKVSEHPDDKNLFYTLIERKNQYARHGKDFATHLYNAEFDSFNWGHYDIQEFKTAIEDFNERGK